jgi:FixJ family two-component response regulator
MGANGFLAKPFTPAALLDAIHVALAAAKSETPRRSKRAEGDRQL